MATEVIDIKLQGDQACEAADQFVKLFYEAFDKRRHVVSKMYMDNASLLWNGNRENGTEAISKFIGNLPSSSHTVDCVDAQPFNNQVSQGQTCILVTTSGSVKYQGNSLKMFNQNFMLTAQNNSWKIVSDCVRTVDS